MRVFSGVRTVAIRFVHLIVGRLKLESLKRTLIFGNVYREINKIVNLVFDFSLVDCSLSSRSSK